jgi:hypothetical protein
MTEQEKAEWRAIVAACPQGFIDALAERTAEVLKRELPKIIAAFDGVLISTADGFTEAEPAKAAKDKTKRFIKPTVEEIRAYCFERNNSVNAESFFNFYEANGWRVGKNPMKDWKASVRTWEQRSSDARPIGQPSSKNAEWNDPFAEYAKQKYAEALSYAQE